MWEKTVTFCVLISRLDLRACVRIDTKFLRGVYFVLKRGEWIKSERQRTSSKHTSSLYVHQRTYIHDTYVHPFMHAAYIRSHTGNMEMGVSTHKRNPNGTIV